MTNEYITFSETTKTFCVTTRKIGMAMVATGNPYSHNRGAIVTNLKKAISGLIGRGFKEVKTETAQKILVTKSGLEINGKQVEVKDRWEAKRMAKALACKLGCSWFNLKDNGKIIEVK